MVTVANQGMRKLTNRVLITLCWENNIEGGSHC